MLVRFVALLADVASEGALYRPVLKDDVEIAILNRDGVPEVFQYLVLQRCHVSAFALPVPACCTRCLGVDSSPSFTLNCAIILCSS